MDLDPVLLSRIQFAFVISFHIIFPAFTIGLAAWLATLEGTRLATGNPVYRRVFDFWLKVFALSFGMGVVTGIVMAFQFGTNWSVLAERTGPIQGPLLVDAARRKQTTGRTDDGLPVHSFRSLLADLATYCRIQATTALNEKYVFTLHTRSTPIQSRAFDLLGVDPDRTQ